jgi:hypothetical protein
MAAARWLSVYQRCLRDHPIRTNIFSGATVMLCGDSLAQWIELGRHPPADQSDASGHDSLLSLEISGGGECVQGYDPSRAAVMVSWSAVGDVPLNMILFSAINRVLRPLGIPQVASLPQSLLKGILFFVPGVIVRMPCFIAYVTASEHAVENLREGRPVGDGLDACTGVIRRKMEQNLADIFTNGARLWIPVNTLAFYVIPTMYRPLTLSCVTVRIYV